MTTKEPVLLFERSETRYVIEEETWQGQIHLLPAPKETKCTIFAFWSPSMRVLRVGWMDRPYYGQVAMKELHWLPPRPTSDSTFEAIQWATQDSEAAIRQLPHFATLNEAEAAHIAAKAALPPPSESAKRGKKGETKSALDLTEAAGD